MGQELESFREWCRSIHDLIMAQQSLEWDQQVIMPRTGAEQRGHQLAAVARAHHERLSDPRLGEWIASLKSGEDLSEDVRADLREAKRAHERAVKVPSSLVSERTRACSMAHAAWEVARPQSDFASFLPHLERVIALTRDLAACINPSALYDAMLDEYEPGMNEVELQALFAELKGALVPLLDRILGSPSPPDPSPLRGHFPIPQQEAFCRKVIGDIGFDLSAGRFDVSSHPFTNGTLRDVRLTTRYDESFLPMALFGALHEAGHGIYEQGLDPSRYRDPAGQACSLGIHESQSRFWENLVGRSRVFWVRYLPDLKAAFPGTLESVGVSDFFRAVNVVKPSLIRVEADEVTYNLHIIMRFELESALMRGECKAGDLPEAWNSKMRGLLGISPPEDRLGVLQDIHWPVGLIGYFPTYTLGNLYGPHFLEAMRRDLPAFDDLVARGEFAPIKAWLNGNIHSQGRRYLASDLCRRVTGTPLTIQPAMNYLGAKYSEVYGF